MLEVQRIVANGNLFEYIADVYHFFNHLTPVAHRVCDTHFS